MLKSHAKQIDTIDTTAMKQLRKKKKKKKKRTIKRRQNRSAALGRPAMKSLGAYTSLRSTNPRP